MIDRRTHPLCTVIRRTPPTPEVCELTCGHRFTHRPYEGCRATRHFCPQCPPERADDRIVASSSTSGDRLVHVEGEPDNVVQFASLGQPSEHRS